MQKYVLCLTALFLVGLSMPARAETLDDDTIHKIFAEIKAAIRDPVKSRDLMEARLDDKYALKSNVTSIIDSNPPKEVLQNRTKEQAIEDTVKSMDSMKIDKYESNISSIQYSGDKKYAYVVDATSSSGTVNVPTDKAGTTAPFAYEGKETCSHIVTLVADQVKIMQSQCDDQIAFKK